MKLHRLLATGAVAALALTACGSTSSSSEPAQNPSEASGTLTVWLQTDAQQSWPGQVANATKAFNATYPNVTVNVQYQTWPDHLTKFDAALAGSSAPDVVELGNTETTKYMAAGALADITAAKGDFDNSDTWLQSLEDAGTYDGALYGVPYYAGSRAIIYRTDMFKDAGASVPTTFAEFTSANDKLMAANSSNPNFSALYFPGKYWYAAMSYVYDFGGAIAKQDGDTWTGTLDSPEAQQGLTTVADVVKKYSRADTQGLEDKQDQAFAQGNIAQIYGNGWERGVIIDPKTGDPKLEPLLASYAMPSAATEGQTMPSFLGGSNLMVTAKSAHTDWATAWVAAMTSTQNMADLVKTAGVLPNNTAQLDLVAPADAAFAKAATNSWFVPTAENWANVEKAGTIPNMLSDIFSGKASVADASKTASEEITSILNGS